MFNIDATLFRAAYTCVSTEKNRYYLKGVYVEPCAAGGATLVSTVGRRLIAVYDESAQCEAAAIVSLEKPALAALKKGKNDSGNRRLIMAAGDTRAWICNSDGSQQIAFQDKPIIDGHFPDWRRVLPNLTNTTPDEVQGYSPRHLDSFGDAYCILRDVKTPALGIRNGEKGGPAYIEFGMPNAFGVLMPVRVKGDFAIPSWVHARARDKTAAV